MIVNFGSKPSSKFKIITEKVMVIGLRYLIQKDLVATFRAATGF